MANKQISDLQARTFDGDSIIAHDVENTDPSTMSQHPYLTGSATGHAVADFVGNGEIYTTDLDTVDKHINGAINELHAINGYSYDAYDDTATYAVGDLCIYNNTLYKCTTAITTPEAWNASHWTATSIADEINTLNTPVPITLSVVETGNMTINDNTSCSIGKLVIISIRFTVTNPINGGRLIINGLPKSISTLGVGTSFISLSSSRKDNGFTVANYTSDAGIITMDTLSAQSYCLNGIYIKE